MSTLRFDWKAQGFASEPKITVNQDQAGLLLYRAWGNTSSEWGSGFFSLEKPSSVLDAELRFNVVDWGNGVHFVSTFRLKPNFPYYVGPVAHGPLDMSRTGTQVFVPPDIRIKMDIIKSKEILRHDVAIFTKIGNA
jgi:hypothetical protein